jgi:hypothetical protein
VVVRSGVAYGVLLIDIGSSVDENSHKIRPPIVTRIVKGTDFVLMGDSAIDGERREVERRDEHDPKNSHQHHDLTNKQSLEIVIACRLSGVQFPLPNITESSQETQRSGARVDHRKGIDLNLIIS